MLLHKLYPELARDHYNIGAIVLACLAEGLEKLPPRETALQFSKETIGTKSVTNAAQDFSWLTI